MTTPARPDMFVLRAPAILTTSYVTSAVTENKGYDQLVLEIDFTIGSLTTAEVKVEYYVDGKWRQFTTKSVSAGVETMSLAYQQYGAGGVYGWRDDLYATFFRVSAKGTGTVTGSSIGINAYLFRNEK